jgi:hypothetical protein
VFTIIFLWINLVVVESMDDKRTKNPIAKSLKDKRYRQTIINSKKIYSRKGKKNEIIKELQSSGTDQVSNSNSYGYGK